MTLPHEDHLVAQMKKNLLAIVYGWEESFGSDIEDRALGRSAIRRALHEARDHYLFSVGSPTAIYTDQAAAIAADTINALHEAAAKQHPDIMFGARSTRIRRMGHCPSDDPGHGYGIRTAGSL